MNTVKKVAGAVLLLCCTLLVLEGGAWLLLRFLSTSPDVLSSEAQMLDAHSDHRLNPDFVWDLKDKSSRLHSADGYRRNAPVPLHKQPKTVRVIAIGTSTLYGIGSGAGYPFARPLYNNETITAFLERLIQERLSVEHPGWRVEVINAGISATNTFHHLVLLNSKLLFYEPDIVVSIEGHNDFYGLAPRDRWNEYSYSTSAFVDEFNGRTFFLPAYTLIRAAANYSNIFNISEKIMKRAWNAKQGGQLAHTPSLKLETPGTEEQAQEEAARVGYIRDFRQIQGLARTEGFTFCVFLQPEITLESYDQLSPDDKKLRDLTERLGSPDLAREQRIRGRLPKIFAKAGIAFHDTSNLAPLNAAREKLYVDYCHLTPAGARVAAQAIFPHLYPLVAKRIPARPHS